MTNLNGEKGEQCQNILGNKNNFRDQKAANKFESNLGNKGTQANI